jgi:hypothetical protein
MCREWDWSDHKKIAALKLGMNYQVCSSWDWISDAKCTALDSLKMALISGVWGVGI